jgi:hypothetical protein
LEHATDEFLGTLRRPKKRSSHDRRPPQPRIATQTMTDVPPQQMLWCDSSSTSGAKP